MFFLILIRFAVKQTGKIGKVNTWKIVKRKIQMFCKSRNFFESKIKIMGLLFVTEVDF